MGNNRSIRTEVPDLSGTGRSRAHTAQDSCNLSPETSTSCGFFSYTFLLAFLLNIIPLPSIPGPFISCSLQSSLQAEDLTEYEIKAGLIYKLTFFTDWPEAPEHTLTIGIIGEDPFGYAFTSVEGTLLEGRRLIILRLGHNPTADQIKRCQAIFIPESSGESLHTIQKITHQSPVLLIGENKGFLEQGGMINLLNIDDRIKFEINNKALKDSGIQMRSSVKRLAVRITGQKDDD